MCKKYLDIVNKMNYLRDEISFSLKYLEPHAAQNDPKHAAINGAKKFDVSLIHT